MLDAILCDIIRLLLTTRVYVMLYYMTLSYMILASVMLVYVILPHVT